MRAAVAVFAKPSKRHHAEGEATWRTPAASMTFTVLKSAVDQWFRHRSGRLGAALAFYSIFSMGPLLLIVTIIAGLLIGAEASRGSLSAEFRSMLGEAGSKAVEAMLAGASSERSGTAGGHCGLEPAAGRRPWRRRPAQGCHEHDLERGGPKGGEPRVVLAAPT
jgi:hypothetical protein